jgi:hypothetical protein
MTKTSYIDVAFTFVIGMAAALVLMGASGTNSSPSYEGVVIESSDLPTFNARCREGFEVKAAFGNHSWGYIIMQKRVR